MPRCDHRKYAGDEVRDVVICRTSPMPSLSSIADPATPLSFGSAYEHLCLCFPCIEKVNEKDADEYSGNDEESEMGCDIHEHVEVYDEENERWVVMGGLPSIGRAYNLFAILADVRSPCEGKIPQIGEIKGIPDDITPGMRRSYEGSGQDAHSANWYTLEEMLSFYWDQHVYLTGYVDPSQFDVWRLRGRPHSWKTRRHLMDQNLISNKEMVDYMTTNTLPPSVGDGYSKLITEVGWSIKIIDFVGPWFRDEYLARLERLGPPDKVRLVFWFDN